MHTKVGPTILETGISARSGRRIGWRVAAVVMALGGVVLFWFDPNRYPFYPVCAFHKVTGLLCPGCGSLRAMHQLLHGHLAAAFRLNPLLIATLPIFAGFAVKRRRRKPQGEIAGFGLESKWWWVIVGIVVAFTAWRNVPGSMFNVLPQ